MATEKIIKYTITIAGIALGLFLFPFVLKVFAPFALAFLVAIPCQKILTFLENRLHISRGIGSALLLAVIVAIFTGLIIFLVYQIFVQGKNLISQLPQFIDALRIQFENIFRQINSYKPKLPAEFSVFAENLIETLQNSADRLSVTVATKTLEIAGRVATGLPNLLLFIAMFILGTFFFSKDFCLITNFFKELFPKKLLSKLSNAYSFLARGFSSYMKAQLILMGMTSALVTIGLWISGIKNSLLWGLICGLVDALPFLGTAVIILPWALLSFAYGDIHTFVALIVIQIIVFIFRQLAEPKIVSHQIGVHPILTLISVYIGLRFFGVLGMIFAPVITMFLVNTYVAYKEKN